MKPETSINQNFNLEYEELSEQNQEFVTSGNQLLSKEKPMGINLKKTAHQLAIATFGVICAANLFVPAYAQSTHRSSSPYSYGHDYSNPYFRGTSSPYFPGGSRSRGRSGSSSSRSTPRYNRSRSGNSYGRSTPRYNRSRSGSSSGRSTPWYYRR